MIIIGIIAIFISCQGYSSLLRMVKIQRYVSWMAGILIQIDLLYIFALLNLLRLGLWLVLILGIVLFCVHTLLALKHHFRFEFERLHYFDLWMWIIGFLMARVLYHSPLIHYDNYSHWALIVKFLVTQGHLPRASDAALINFTSYPPESALWLTYVLKWTGFSEGMMLLAQFILIWLALYALFAVLRDPTRGLMGFVICFTIALTNIFNISIRMNNLLVDYLLPVLAAAGLAAIYAHRDKLGPQLFLTFLFINALLLTKNSGTFYAVILGVYLLWCRIHYQPAHRRLFKIGAAVGQTILTFIVSYGPFYAWQQHVHQTFAKVSKHEISSQAYQQQLGQESHQRIVALIRKIGKAMIDTNNLSTRGIVLINVLLCLTWIVFRFLLKRQTHLLQTWLAVDVIFVLYDLSLLGMYLVSMPYNEAIQLDGFDRYRCSLVILNLLISAMVIAVTFDYNLFQQTIEKRTILSFYSIITKNIYQIASACLMIFAIILMFSEINGIQYNDKIGQNELPVQLKRISSQTKRLNHEHVLLVDPHKTDVNDYYTGYVGRYYYFSDKVVGQENFMMSKRAFKKTLNQYQYVAIPEWHRTFTVMTEKVYHQHIKTGLFKVSKNHLQRVEAIR